jgi:DNA-binding NarL/FixJ family response regulator
MVRILLIEDTEAVRCVFRTILGQAGYVVREASGPEGIRLVPGSPSDIVISDREGVVVIMGSRAPATDPDDVEFQYAKAGGEVAGA